MGSKRLPRCTQAFNQDPIKSKESEEGERWTKQATSLIKVLCSAQAPLELQAYGVKERLRRRWSDVHRMGASDAKSAAGDPAGAVRKFDNQMAALLCSPYRVYSDA